MNSFTEENYLKAIYQLARKHPKGVSTTALAKRLKTQASSATDMLQKLSGKKLVSYRKYRGATLTDAGQKAALQVLRKHRLWEVFLVEKLQFRWDQVHELAEQLEHIRSEELVARLDRFLGHPTHDPHGDPIPDKNGHVFHHKDHFLSDLQAGETAVIIGVKDSGSEFLRYLEEKKLLLGRAISVQEVTAYDGSMQLLVEQQPLAVSRQVAQNLYVRTTVIG